MTHNTLMKNMMKFFLVLALVTPIALTLTACGNNGYDEYTPGPEPIILAAPTNILISHQVISWDAVEHANAYLVTINNHQFTTYETEFTSPTEFTPGGRYAIGVMALGAQGDSTIFQASTPATVNHRQPKRFLNYSDFTPFGGDITEIPNGIRFGESRYSGGSVAFISGGLYPNRTADFVTFDARRNNLEKGAVAPNQFCRACILLLTLS